MGWVQFVLAESQSRLYPHMCAKLGCDPTAGSKKLPLKFIIGCSQFSFEGTRKNKIFKGIILL